MFLLERGDELVDGGTFRKGGGYTGLEALLAFCDRSRGYSHHRGHLLAGEAET